jgi:hypothetical protein
MSKLAFYQIMACNPVRMFLPECPKYCIFSLKFPFLAHKPINMPETHTPIEKINDIVKRMLYEQHLTAVDLAQAMGWSYDSGYKLLKRSDWKISEMQAAGKLLKFDFFSLYANMPNVAQMTKDLKDKDAIIQAQNQKLAMLEMENKYLKELVEMAKLKLKK